MAEPFDFRVVDQLELAVGLVDDLAVGEHPCPVNETADRAECLANIGHDGIHGGRIAHIDRAIFDRRAGPLDPLELAADLALEPGAVVLSAATS